jgi:hypothetical protein
MYKNATKCNETIGKWCKTKHGASKIIDTFETYHTAMIQPVPKSHKEEKSISRQVNLAITSPPVTTEYLHWSEQPIEFNREDHPIIVPRPGNTPLVLKA